MIPGILIAAAAGWIVSEATDISPWLAIRLVRWAAIHLYPSNPERAERRREEWEALIDRAIPSKTLKLLFGLSFGCAGLYRIVVRHAPLVLSATGRGILKALKGIAESVALSIPVGIANAPGFWPLILIGGMFALIGIGAGLAWVLTLPRATRKYRRHIFGPDNRLASSTPTPAGPAITPHAGEPGFKCDGTSAPTA